MSTRSGRIRQSVNEPSPPRTRKGVSPSQSPARKPKTSPITRTSKRSPPRRSPSRKTISNYPARKSPSRAVKDTKSDKDIEVVTIPKSPIKRPTIRKEIETIIQNVPYFKQEITTRTRTRRSEYSLKDIPGSVLKTNLLIDEKINGFENTDSVADLYNLRNRKNIDEVVVPRRSSKLRDISDPQDIKRSFTKSLSKSVSESISKSVDTYSDDENSDEKHDRKSEPVVRKLSTPIPTLGLLHLNKLEFGGRIGSALLILIIPFVVFSLLISCKSTCSWNILMNPSSYQSFSSWFNVMSVILVISQLILQLLFVSLPVLGTIEVNKNGQKHCFNGFFSSFCTIGILCLLEYLQILNSDNLLDLYLQMAFVSYITAILLSILLNVIHVTKEENLNPYGHSKYSIYNFFMGKEILPTIWKINIKLWMSRISNITALTLSILVFKRGFSIQEIFENISLEELTKLSNKIQLKPTTLIFSLMQITYSLYFLIKESNITSTFFWQSEGMGYLQIVSSALYPYYFTIISKYVSDTELTLPANMLIAASMLFVLGFLVMLISNNIKHEFRKNPLHPSLTHLNSMPTFHGKKLLISNVWGVLRHPNYAGDILIHLALSFPGIYSQQILSAAPALLTILVLIHRSWRDHGRCKRRYGTAWERYCKRVPSIVIPKIF